MNRRINSPFWWEQPGLSRVVRPIYRDRRDGGRRVAGYSVDVVSKGRLLGHIAVVFKVGRYCWWATKGTARAIAEDPIDALDFYSECNEVVDLTRYQPAMFVPTDLANPVRLQAAMARNAAAACELLRAA